MGGMWTPRGPNRPGDWRSWLVSTLILLALVALFAVIASAGPGNPEGIGAWTTHPRPVQHPEGQPGPDALGGAAGVQ